MLSNGDIPCHSIQPWHHPSPKFLKKLPKIFWVITKRNLKFQLHRNSGTHFFFMTDFAPKHSFLTPRSPNFDVGRFTKIHNLRHILLYLLWKCTGICNFSQGIQKSTLESLKIKTNTSFETRYGPPRLFLEDRKPGISQWKIWPTEKICKHSYFDFLYHLWWKLHKIEKNLFTFSYLTQGRPPKLEQRYVK